MNLIEKQILEGERALFNSKDLKVSECRFKNGESPLKESKNIEVVNSSFSWKYPLWYGKNIKVKDCFFDEMARSGIWNTDSITLENCKVYAPKTFRRSSNIKVFDTELVGGAETLWSCNNVTLKNVKAEGDYFLMNSTNVEIDNLTIDGNYILDGAKNVVVRNSILNSKDSFWNCENVKVINCKIVGEYIGWNSKNITFEDCDIESHQGFCYIQKLTLKNCKLTKTDLAFEYSTVNADINSKVDSIKNPTSGVISCDGYAELIMEPDKVDVKKTKIIVKGKI